MALKSEAELIQELDTISQWRDSSDWDSARDTSLHLHWICHWLQMRDTTYEETSSNVPEGITDSSGQLHFAFW